MLLLSGGVRSKLGVQQSESAAESATTTKNLAILVVQNAAGNE